MKVAECVVVLTAAITLGYVAYGPIRLFCCLRVCMQCLYSFGDNAQCNNSIIGSFFSGTDTYSAQNVTLYCHFRPLELATMDRDLRDMPLSMRGLLEWQKPNKYNITLNAHDFSYWLPSSDKKVGDIWHILEPVEYRHEDEALTHDLSMRLKDEEPSSNTAASTLYHILSMFHRNIFLQTRFMPRGTIAILRAQNSEFIDIVFRCHAEFQLNNPPLFPFWFTPAQFQGQLLITRNSSRITKFTLAVPTHRKLNVDMEFINNVHTDMEVDIGFIPQMLIHSAENESTETISWDEQITLENAHVILEKKLFPFKEITYKPIEEALSELSTEQKPLHCIILWGALDDQSC